MIDIQLINSMADAYRKRKDEVLELRAEHRLPRNWPIARTAYVTPSYLHVTRSLFLSYRTSLILRTSMHSVMAFRTRSIALLRQSIVPGRLPVRARGLATVSDSTRYGFLAELHETIANYSLSPTERMMSLLSEVATLGQRRALLLHAQGRAPHW